MLSREKPLALYIFSNDVEEQSLIIRSTISGGVTINDVMMHATVDSLPFGGVGFSGMGAYHGRDTYDTFVHRKGCLLKTFNKVGESISSCRYPPYTERKLKLLTSLMAKRPDIPGIKYLPHLLMFGLGVLVTVGLKAALKEMDQEDQM